MSDTVQIYSNRDSSGTERSAYGIGKVARALWLLVALSFPGLLAAPQAVAEKQAFPTKPLTIVVPYGKGGGSHQFASAMARAFKRGVGKRVKIVNLPGASGAEGYISYLSDPHDGYTILQEVDFLASRYAAGEVSINPAGVLRPILIGQITFSQLYIRTLDSRFRDWDSLLDYARAADQPLRVANVGSRRSMERINMTLMERELDIRFENETYDRPSERYQALINGDVDLLFEQPGDVIPFLRRQLIKPVITFSDEPLTFDNPKDARLLDDAPILPEVGLVFEPLLRYRGLFVHADIPPERFAFLEDAFAKAWKAPSFQRFNRERLMHLVDSYQGPQEARESLVRSISVYSREMSRLGLD